MTIIVERDESLIDLFRSAVGSGSRVVHSTDELLTHLESTPNEYAVILGPSVDLGSATTIAEHARVERPSLGFVLVRERLDHQVLGSALRAGMRDVVESRDLTRLAAAVHLAHGVWEAMTEGERNSSPAGAGGRLVTVFSTKGGVGKSTVATNLAAALVQPDRKVCIVDLDVQSGDVAIMLQLFPHRTLADLHHMDHGVDQSGVESLMTQHPSGLSVLVAPVQVDAKVSPGSVGAVLQTLKTMYDVVVVDTSGSFDDYALVAIDNSDVLLLVGTLDIPALKSLKVATETLELLNIPRSKWKLVLNRADAKVGLSPSDFEKTLEMEISLSVPSSIEVPASVNRGECLVLAHPRHPVSQSIRSLAEEIAAGAPALGDAGRAVASGSSASPARRGLLRRRVK